MQEPDPDLDATNWHGNLQYQQEQIQTSQAFPEGDTSTMNPNLLSLNQNVYEPPVPQFPFHSMQHVQDGGWPRAANPQLGPPGPKAHQLSVNTAPPFTSRPTSTPRREYHSENSANMQERFNSQVLGPGYSNVSASLSPYSGQLVRSTSYLFSLPYQL